MTGAESGDAGGPNAGSVGDTFLAAYDRVMQRWPEPPETLDLTSPYGQTRVWACGPADASPLVLIPAYNATSAEWIELALALQSERRIYAIDMIGDAGRSRAGATPISTPDDMNHYLDTILDGLHLTTAEVCGHSYGAWIALTYALASPDRVSRVTLLDPTMAFAPLFPAYVLRAVPVLMKPTAARRASLIRWETRGQVVTGDWLALTGLATEGVGIGSTVPTKIPKADVLKALRPPVLMITAGRTKVHSERRVRRNAGRRLPPTARLYSVKGASHYGLPMTHAAQVAELLRTSPTESAS